MRVLEVVAINNEKMYVPALDVRMVGPLMDRGLAMLGRSVLYVENLPPLPIKEARADVIARLGWEVVHVAEDQTGAGDSDGSADEGSAGGTLVEA